MDKRFNPVVMAGGVGSRLWPLSRASCPKQYQQLVDNENDYTMLQQTFARLSGLVLGKSQLICNQDHRFLAAEQIRRLGEEIPAYAGMTAVGLDIVLEPLGRNTAPAVILSALRLIEIGTDDPMLVLSADHSIIDEVGFRAALVNAHQLAELGNLVTLGVEPNFACTGYGYIRCGAAVSGTGFNVSQFVEKPNEATAEKYLVSGDYLWNSGMFIVRPSALIEEAGLYCAGLLQQCRLVVDSADRKSVV